MKTLKHYLFFILSLFSVLVFVTSCDKITDLLGGGEEGDDDESEIIGEIETSDGKEPYFKFTSEAVVIPACGKNHEERENTYTIKYETNIINGISFCLDSFKKFEENGENIETSEDIPYFILREPRFEMQSQSETAFNYFTNPKTEDIKDKILVYMYNKPDSLVASLDITQAAGEWVKVVDAEKDIKSVTLHLQNSENAVAYGTYITKEYTPLSVLQREVAQSDNGYSVFRERQEYIDNGRTLKFDNLEENQEYFVNIAAIDKYDNFTGITQYVISTDTRGEEHELRMKFSLNPINKNTVYLPFDGEIKGYIDWGDGTEEQYLSGNYSSGSIKHEYSNPGEVTVSFRGKMPRLIVYGNESNIRNSLLSIEQWGDTDLEEICLSGVVTLKSLPADKVGAFRNIKSFKDSFRGCTALTDISPDLFSKTENVKDFDDTFYECTSLTKLPENMFAGAINATSFDGTFSGCTALTEIPENIFFGCENAEYFNYVFSRCSSLESIPENLFIKNLLLFDISFGFSSCEKLKSIPQGLFSNNTNLYSIKCLFKGCSSITAIPERLFVNNKGIYSITYTDPAPPYLGWGLFEGCTSLQIVPVDLFSTMVKVEDMRALFSGCTSLTNIPEGLFDKNSNVERMGYAFNGCKNLSSVPASLFDNMRSLIDVESIFYNCSVLSGESPYTMINGQRVHLYERKNYNLEFVKIKFGYNAFEGTNITDKNMFNGRWWESFKML